MRKNLLPKLLLFSTLSFPAFGIPTQESDQDRPINLHQTNSNGNHGHRAPEKNPFILSAFINSDSTGISLFTNREETVSIEIISLSNYQTLYSDYSILSYEETFIPLSSGDMYEINILLSNGISYSGEFTL